MNYEEYKAGYVAPSLIPVTRKSLCAAARLNTVGKKKTKTLKRKTYKTNK